MRLASIVHEAFARALQNQSGFCGEGALVLFYWGPNQSGGKTRSWLYADGRRLWMQEGSFLE